MPTRSERASTSPGAAGEFGDGNDRNGIQKLCDVSFVLLYYISHIVFAFLVLALELQ